MSEPIRDLETAVRELGALPMPAGSEPQMPPEQRAAIAELIGDAKPATAHLVEQLAKSVRDRREHEHPTWEDLYCLNLVSWAGERLAPVLRRLLDAEDRVERRRVRLVAAEADLLAVRGLLSPAGGPRRVPSEITLHERVAPAVEWLLDRIAELEKANEGLDDLRVRALDKNTELRAAFEAQQTRAETLDRLLREAQDRIAEYERPADEDPIRYALTESAPLTVYRASHDSIPMGLYTTAAEARAHCEADERRSWMAGTNLSFDWIEDDGVAELVVTAGQNEESTTNYVVEALEVAAKHDAEADE